jgi:hypothetical protein
MDIVNSIAQGDVITKVIISRNEQLLSILMLQSVLHIMKIKMKMLKKQALLEIK